MMWAVTKLSMNISELKHEAGRLLVSAKKTGHFHSITSMTFAPSNVNRVVLKIQQLKIQQDSKKMKRSTQSPLWH